MEQVYEEKKVKLQGWPKTITVRPLVIKEFRRVAAMLDNIANPDEEHKDLLVVDILLKATAIAMETFETKLADIEELEKYVDMATMEHILNIATGVKINDPNPK